MDQWQAVGELVGGLIILVWLLTGAAFWLRWGYAGIEVIWAIRHNITAKVKREMYAGAIEDDLVP